MHLLRQSLCVSEIFEDHHICKTKPNITEAMEEQERKRVKGQVEEWREREEYDMDGRKHDGFLTEMHTIIGYMQEACNWDFLQIEFIVRVLIFAKSL